VKAHGLEILRFFSAFSVLVWHYQHFYAAEKMAYVANEQPLYKYLSFFITTDLMGSRYSGA
jgi:peptidoglycan/LPS O-acetylase OafA/YrhL